METIELEINKNMKIRTILDFISKYLRKNFRIYIVIK